MMAKQVPDHSNLSPRADDRKVGLQPRGLIVVTVRFRCLRAPIPLCEVPPRYTALIPLSSLLEPTHLIVVCAGHHVAARFQ